MCVRRSLFWLSLLIVMSVLEGCRSMDRREVEAADPTPNAPSEAAPEVVRLPNGLDLVLVENRSAPVVAMQMWVKFGSADENPTYAGVAHLFEHMIFKGSERYPNGEIGAIVESSGGRINAWTSFDETVYHVVVGKQFWDQAADALLDAMANPLFDADELAKEREVVVEEIRRGEDSPDRQLFERMAELTYKRHPYGRSVIGTPETVRSVDRPTLVDVFQRWYVPNNMVWVAVGDFDAAQMRQKVEAFFGRRDRSELPERPRHAEPAQQAPRADTFSHTAELARVQIGFPGLSETDPDAAAADVLADIVGGGFNSRLFQALKRKRNLAQNVFAFHYPMLDPGFFLLGAQLESEQFEEAFAVLADIVADAGALQISESELEEVKTRILSEFVHGREAVQGQARLLGQTMHAWDDPEAFERYLDELRGVTVADLRRVAQRLLKPARANIAYLVPKGVEPPDAETLLSAWQANVTATAAQPQVEVLDKTRRVSRVQLPEGPQVIVQQDAKVPVINVTAKVEGGLRAEPADKAGVGRLMSRVWPRGTALRSAGEIERLLDRIGGDVDANIDRDTLTLSMDFLSEHAVDGFALFGELFNEATFPEDELIRERDDQVLALETLKENRFRYGLTFFLAEMYDDHPYSRLTIGTPETVPALTRADVRAFYRAHQRPQDMVFTVVGDIAPQQAAQYVSKLLQDTDAGSGRAPASVTAPSFTDDLRERVQPIDGEQTHILWGFPTVDTRNEDRFALRILDTILSGMGGRLFTELRDEKSLAYSVTSIDVYPVDPGFFLLYIGTSPGKEAIAIDEFERVLREVKTEGVDETELARAKRFLTGSMAITLQRGGARSNIFARNQLLHGHWDYHDESLAQLNAVTSDDVRRAAQRYLNPERSVRVVLRADRD